MNEFILLTYFFALLVLGIFGSHGFVMVYHYFKHRDNKDPENLPMPEFPKVTIQLPIYNEMYVVRRLIEASCAIEYPADKLEIQVLDDSTDETVELVARIVREMQARGHNILHIRRSNRQGFKAGALKEGLKTATGDYIAIFDADFVPRQKFLMKTLVHFFTDPKIGMVQTRWEHLNGEYSLLTRTQAMALDGHFVMEQTYRNKAGFFINFNGTGGVWRKSCIEDAGNWQSDTLTEDLDLSYRAQLRGWKFKFLRDVTSPAELPAEINALKSQQFRWTKGAIETARKMLPAVWKSDLSLRMKVHSTFHLTSNFAFPFTLVAAVLNVPLLFIKHAGGYEPYFEVLSVFIFAFLGSFLFYTFSQVDVHADWRRRIFLFPLFMAGSMGFAVNNSKAVFEGLFKKKSEFVRTPKYSINEKKDSWKDKKYVPVKLNWTVFVEIALALYCSVGVVSAIYYLEIAAVPFQLLFCMGFSFVSFLSVQQAFQARKHKVEQLSLGAEPATA
ncbi:MAG: glycosyltransferase family 2 protein [Ignavibacteriales bacterium]|nr:glycosyltransferase family 2 protein [Ignavibacteriales bacterium]